MESIYYVLSWLCHRRCKHCYDSRFRPYRRSELEAVVGEARANFPAVIDNLPETMRYRDPATLDEARRPVERTGRIILSGGEVLVEPTRESVLYPAMERLSDRYAGQGGVKLVVQTTGDLVTPTILDELLARGLWQISISGIDDFHVGIRGDKRDRLVDHLTAMFERAGLRASGLSARERKWQDDPGPLYSFFGATPESWIGKLWPRGRAWENDLSQAGIEDNFCNAWSGGLNFLNHGWAGSEVSIEPSGDVYPCCMKTRYPIGNLLEERLTDILDSLAGHPVYEAIAMGHPERMGLSHGWSRERFLERCATQTPSGRPYRNLCIGCDRFHEEVLGPVLQRLREERRAARRAAA